MKKYFTIRYEKTYQPKIVAASNMFEAIQQFQQQMFPIHNIGYLEIEEVDSLPCVSTKKKYLSLDMGYS